MCHKPRNPDSNIESIVYLVASDLHLGHRKTPTKEIIDHFQYLLESYDNKSDLDIIFLAGDVFDRLLEYPSDESSQITLWAGYLLNYCHKYQIKLRILEGTSIHDFGQSKIFETVSTVLQKSQSLNVDCRYICSISVEVMEDLELSILYIPDNTYHDTDLIYQEVLKTLQSKHMTQVDIGIFHGQFRYQLPGKVDPSISHIESRYLEIVRYYINIGHIHTFMVYERIIGQGSFDRLAHSEEEPKGMVQCIINKGGESSYWFIENRSAKVYKTILLRKEPIETAIKLIEKKLKKIPFGSHIRLKMNRDHPLVVGFRSLKDHFPDYHWTKVFIEEERDVESKAFNIEEYKPIVLSKENTKGLLLDLLVKNYEMTPNHHKTYHDLFTDGQ